VHVFEVRDLHLAGLLALFILFEWEGIERRHRGIIAYPVACCFVCSGQAIRVEPKFS
jgi:hypothetical protein